MTTFIYCLVDPRTNQIRYVGKANNPKIRYKQHLNKKIKNYVHYWIQSLNKEGQFPELFIIDEVPKVDWIFWEQHYISLYKSWGFKLTNLTSGGDGLEGFKHSQLTKTKISILHKGRKLTDQHKKALSDSIRKIRVSPSEETKIKMIKASIKRFSDPIKLEDHRRKAQLRNGKKILVIDINKNETEYNAINEASRVLNIRKSRIDECINPNHRRNSYKGFIFKLL